MIKEKYKGYAYSKLLEQATDEQIRLLGKTPFLYHLKKDDSEYKNLINDFLKDYPPYYPEIIREDKNYSEKEMANKIINRGIYKAVFNMYNPLNKNPLTVETFVQMLKDTISKRYVDLIKTNELNDYLLKK